MKNRMGGRNPMGMEANDVGFPCCGTLTGMEKFLWDSCGNVAVFYFYGAPSSTKSESTDNK